MLRDKAPALSRQRQDMDIWPPPVDGDKHTHAVDTVMCLQKTLLRYKNDTAECVMCGRRWRKVKPQVERQADTQHPVLTKRQQIIAELEKSAVEVSDLWHKRAKVCRQYKTAHDRRVALEIQLAQLNKEPHDGLDRSRLHSDHRHGQRPGLQRDGSERLHDDLR